MARYLKNTQLTGGSHTVQLPLGTMSVGPDVPVNGQVRYNMSNNRVEFYFDTSWHQVAQTGLVTLVIDEYDGSQFNVNYQVEMSQLVVSPTDIVVFIGGIYQAPTTNYTVAGTLLTLASPPPTVDAWGNPNKIVVIHNLNSTDAAYN